MEFNETMARVQNLAPRLLFVAEVPVRAHALEQGCSQGAEHHLNSSLGSSAQPCKGPGGPLPPSREKPQAWPPLFLAFLKPTQSGGSLDHRVRSQPCPHAQFRDMNMMPSSPLSEGCLLDGGHRSNPGSPGHVCSVLTNGQEGSPESTESRVGCCWEDGQDGCDHSGTSTPPQVKQWYDANSSLLVSGCPGLLPPRPCHSCALQRPCSAHSLPEIGSW